MLGGQRDGYHFLRFVHPLFHLRHPMLTNMGCICPPQLYLTELGHTEYGAATCVLKKDATK